MLRRLGEPVVEVPGLRRPGHLIQIGQPVLVLRHLGTGTEIAEVSGLLAGRGVFGEPGGSLFGPHGVPLFSERLLGVG